MSPLARRIFALAIAVALWGRDLPAQDSVQPARSPRNASYSIDVRLETDSGTLAGRQILTWRNIQDQATEELWFHLYWNGWRNNRSTWLTEDLIRGRSTAGEDLEEGDWGYQTISSIKIRRLSASAAAGAEPPAAPALPEPGDSAVMPRLEEIDLSDRLRFAAPDDGNPEDRTVAVLDLPFAVEPGESLEVEMVWQAKIPKVFARTGSHGPFYFIAHWFPKLGVFEGDGWNCHQFHSSTEFFSDYGNYDVRMTVPEAYILGATGRRIEKTFSADGTATHRYSQTDVHGFAWTTSPDYLERTARFEEPGLPPVDLRLLLQPEHEGQAERHFEATRTTLKYYGSWYGPYPYDHLTIIDPAFGSGTGGMEYPTLFTSGTRLLNPFRGGSPEGVTIHESGHQFWYGVVGNNEFEHAWLDEGLNTFSTARAYEAAFGERRVVRRYLSLPGSHRGFLPVLFPDLLQSRRVFGNRLNRFRQVAPTDRQSKASYLYYPGTSSRTSYDKTALWLATLEEYLGWETLQNILSTFYRRWSFKHPVPQDFISIANEVSGQDLSWFFDQVYDGSQIFDYAVGRVTSKPWKLEGFSGAEGDLRFMEAKEKDEEDEEGGGGKKIYRSEVVVQRRGDGIFPVDVLLAFEDGTEVRRSWDGRDDWTLFVEQGPSKLEYAAVDPDGVLILDLNSTNNTRRIEAKASLPAYKWGSRWMVWLQDLLLTFSFFI